MVAIFTGAGTGLERGSASILGGAGLLGSAANGRSGEQVLVNAANGNLVISQRDEFLVGRGPDVSIGRTYNSAATFDGDNNDRWLQTTTRRILNHSGSYNTTGSTVQRLSADGSIITYTHNGSVYVATDGAGAHDTLSYDAGTSVWTWDDGASSITETYEGDPYASGNWRITQQSDNQDGSIAFTYSADKLYRATTSDGSYTQYNWSGSTITEIVTGYTDLQTSTARTLTRTRYSYDGYNRLSRVTVDLSPDDNSIGDGNTYYTDYTYHGSSTLIATITQKDGSSLAVSYDGSNRVTSLTQTVASGVTRTTTLAYSSGSTVITDPAGQLTTLEYDGKGALTRIITPPPVGLGPSQTVVFGYDGSGNLTSVTDALGAVTSYTYDARGNLLTETDRLGNTVTRTYESTRNLMVTETRVGADKDGAAQSHTTRYVYDANERLAYSLSAEGVVKRYAYSAAAAAVDEVQSLRFDLSAYGSTSVPDITTLNNWWTTQITGTDIVLGRVSELLDARGNVTARVAYSRFGADYINDFTGERVNFVYDQAGQLLSRTPLDRPQSAETYVYDGLGRVVASTDADGGATSFVFDDAQTRTIVTLASGLVQTSTYNKVGGLVAMTETATSGNAGYFVGGTTTYRYDDVGRLRQIIDPLNASTFFIYDKAGRKTAEIRHAGLLQYWASVVEYRYDANDRVIATARYTYGANKTGMAQLIDTNTPNWALTIDQLRPVESLPGGEGTDVWQWFAYDAEGRVTRTILGDGSVATHQYDASGQLVENRTYETKLTASQLVDLRAGTTTAAVVALPSAHVEDAVTRQFYDRDGRVIGTLDAEGYLTRTIYDAGGRKAQDIAYATATNVAYRAAGTFQQLLDTTATHALDRSARYVYNGRNQLRYVIDALGYVTSYGYAATSSATPNHFLDQPTSVTRYAAPIGTLSSYNEVSLRTALAGQASSVDNRTSYTVYNGRGQIAYTVDEGGMVTGYAYDNMGNTIRETRYATKAIFTGTPSIGTIDGWAGTYAAPTSDRTTRYYYTDRPGEVRLVIDPEGYATRYDYDEAGRRIATYRYDAKVSYTGQDLGAAYSAAVSAGTGSHTYTWTRIEPSKPSIRIDYNGEGESLFTGYWLNGAKIFDVVMYQDAASEQKTAYWNDAVGRTIKMSQAFTSPDAIVTSYVYDGHGNLVEVRDPRNNLTTRDYDRLGRLVRETDALGGFVTYEYNAFGEVVKTTDRRGFATYTYYDNLGRASAVRDAENYVTETAYTAFGEVQSVTRRYAVASGTPVVGTPPTVTPNALDATTQFEYDKLGRVTKVIDAELNYEQYVLDAFGNRVQVRNKLGGWTTNVYDRRGLLTKETLPVSSYDRFGTQLSTTVDNSYAYDARGNRTSTIEAYGLPEQRVTTYVYDRADRLIEVVHDPVTAYTLTGGTTVTPREQFTYDDRGNLIRTIDANGAATYFYYDRLDRKAVEIDAAGTVRTYAYDANGNVLTERVYATPAASTPLGGPAPYPASGDYREITYTYDALDRLVTRSLVNVEIGRWNATTALYASAAGNAVTTYAYDAMGNVTQVTDAEGGVATYTYDKLGRRTRQVDQLNYVTDWQYDAEGNVTQEFRHSLPLGHSMFPFPNLEDRVTNFTYDRNGRRRSEMRLYLLTHQVDSVGALSLVSGVSTISYDYNAAGQVTSRTEATGDVTTYQYDDAGRLRTEIKPQITEYSTGYVTPTVEYFYDGLGNLTMSRAGAATPDSSDRVTRYVYSAGGRLYQVQTPDGNYRTYWRDAAGRTVVEAYNREISNAGMVGEGVTYSYDATGRITQQGFVSSSGGGFALNAATETTTFTYNGYGDLATRAVNGVVQESYDYDGAGRVSRASAGDGVWRIHVYDGNGNRTLTLENPTTNLSGTSVLSALSTTSNGNQSVGGYIVTINRYTARGELSQIRLPDRQLNSSGAMLSIVIGRAYNAFGELFQETDARGNFTIYRYDTAGNIIEVRKPMVTVTSETGVNTTEQPIDYRYYDASGRLIASRDANGNLTSRILLAGSGYNGTEALFTKEFHADGGVLTREYDRFGDLRVSNDELGRATVTFYDKMGRAAQITRPGQNYHEYFAYNLFGQRIRHWNSLLGSSLVEMTDYDAQGRVTSLSTLGGEITTTSYQWRTDIANAGMSLTGGWRQTTSYQNGLYSVSDVDSFGREVSRTDLGGHVTSYSYDTMGRLTQLAGGGATTSFTNLNTGLLGASVRSEGGTVWRSAYNYDAAGNRVGEHYQSEVGATITVYQDTTVYYDALGRMAQWTEAGSAAMPAASISYLYDANGNVRRVYTQHRQLDGQGNVTGLTVTKDQWFRYDAMNRVVTADGVQTGSGVHRGNAGVDYLYNAAGELVRATRYAGRVAQVYNPEYDGTNDYYMGVGYTAVVREDYEYTVRGQLQAVRYAESTWVDDWNGGVIVTDPTGPGGVIGSFAYDLMGRLTRQIDYAGSQVIYDRQITAYSGGSGRVATETIDQLRGGTTYHYETQNDYQVGSSGYALGALVSSYTYTWVGGVYQGFATTVNTYEWWDGATLNYQTNTPAGGSAAVTDYSYDAQGQLTLVDVGGARPHLIAFINDANGQAIRRDESAPGGGLSGSQNPHEVWYRYAGRELGYIGNNGSLETSYAASVTERGRAQSTNAFRTGSLTPAADFTQDPAPLTSFAQGGAGGGYIVQAGDTLAGIAANLWGDAALWYKLAEANGLSGGTALAAGQQLIVPAGVQRSSFTAATFTPYDPAGVLGDTSPLAPTPPKAPKKAKCGAFGQILVSIVAVAVTAIVAPWATGVIAGAGKATALATAAGGAIGGVAGSVASQAVGIATGVQDRFSWKGVALAAIGGAASGGLAKTPGLSGASGLDEVMQGVARGALGNAISQGVGVVTGLQSRFDWTGVAVGAVVGGVTAAAGQALKVDWQGTGLGDRLAQGAAGAAGALAGAAARSIATGTSFGDNVRAVLPDVIGATLGNVLADRVVGLTSGGLSNPVMALAAPAQIAGAVIAPGENPGARDATGDIVVTAPRWSWRDAIVDKLGGAWSTFTENAFVQRITQSIMREASDPMIPFANTRLSAVRASMTNFTRYSDATIDSLYAGYNHQRDYIDQRYPYGSRDLLAADFAAAGIKTIASGIVSIPGSLAHPLNSVRAGARGLARAIDNALVAENTPASVQFGRAAHAIATATPRQTAAMAGTVAGNLFLAATPARLGVLSKLGEAGHVVRGANIYRAERPLFAAEEAGARFGIAASNDYRATFFAANPELRGQVVVHHAVEQQVLARYPGVVSEAGIHSLENLRGIPKEMNSDLHLSQIRREWNQFYRQNVNPTQQQLLNKATEIDIKFGSQFNPPVR